MLSFPPRCRFVTGLVAAILTSAAAASGKDAESIIRSVAAATADGAGAIVTIHADGPLPAPVVGVLAGPPRLYLDFRGVTLRLDAPPLASGPAMRGIRVGLYRRSPSVVRVVLDLNGPTPHRIDATGRALGTVAVVLGAATTPASAGPAVADVRTPSVASPPRPAAAVGTVAAPVETSPLAPAAAAAGAVPAPRPRDVERYSNLVAPVLARLTALRPSIAAIAGDAAPPPDDLLTAAVELDGIRGSLKAMRVPASQATTHDLLMRFCALAFRAAHLRIDPGSAGDPEAMRNAASAAAGALIVLDRASRDLGYPSPQ